ncbi:MAG: aspartate aminotransferase family protein [Pseudomonadota bacterium]
MDAQPLFPNYARADLQFERGEGCWLISTDGERYLDFSSGIAVNSLGHAHPHLVEALTDQAQKLWHVSNAVRIPDQERLGARLCANTFADRVLFTNSGAEALEVAIKSARRFHYDQGAPEKYRLITFEGAFHGRTLATIAAGGQPKYLEGFGPPVEGFDQVAFEDLEAVKASIGPETAGILVEPIQGEGGVRVMDFGVLRALRKLCDDHGLLLLLDEVQTGVGRTGRLFCHEWADIEPDLMAIAKGIGGGFPVGACLARAEIADCMVPGTHGTTFGGNPLAMAVGNAVLDVVLEPGFLDEVKRKGLVMKQKVAALVDEHPTVFAGVRGDGLMLGLKCEAPVGDVIAAARSEQLLGMGAGENVMRLLPPLIVDDGEIDEAVTRLDRAAFALETARTVDGVPG